MQKIERMVYRPYLQEPYKAVAMEIAEKMNETSLYDFDDLVLLEWHLGNCG